MGGHTKEPWEAATDCPGECCWHLQQAGNEDPFCRISDPEMSEEDARRIVACVNACAGIETDLLMTTEGEYTSINLMIGRLIQQRDELMSAARMFFPNSEFPDDFEMSVEAIMALRSAINNVGRNA